MIKKYLYLLLPIILFLLTGCSNNNNENISDDKLALNSPPTNSSNNNTTNIAVQRITVPLNNVNSNTVTNTNENNFLPAETEISSFSTEILTSDPNRNNNIELTCNTLNEHIVKSNETFSFTDLIGKSTSSKGYKSANIISADGDTTKGLGGGNCQVSSTLYNAVVAIPELEIIERHNHGAEIYYLPIGQDAAVSYGSVDFKFKNNLSSDIKIYASTDNKNVTIKINKINKEV